MKLLLTGATGYIGKRLLPVLLSEGHTVVCCVRDKNRFTVPEAFVNQIEVIEVDFLDENSLKKIPRDIEGAYYLIHSMSTSKNYDTLELQSAVNFRKALKETSVKHVIYLSGIVNEESLSKHLKSRKAVEEELAKGAYNFTTLRAGIIIGSGSASFEIIRDLVEKLPLMVAPKWLNVKCQPIAVFDVINILFKSLFNPATYNQSYDIGGPDIITYKEMLLGFAQERKLKRWIFTVPVMTPRISSYWLYFITSTSYRLAIALVSSMKVEVICRNNDLVQMLGITPFGYRESLTRTLSAVQEDRIPSSWKDSLISGRFEHKISEFLTVPVFGCLTDSRTRSVTDHDKCLDKIWSIGGNNGWYYADFLWGLRGFIDKLVGGIGLRRGRTTIHNISAGDAIDFWRVLYANKDEARLLLFAEMKLPGEAWLEFKIENGQLIQTATFRPRGILGRLYWYTLVPIHHIIFNGMIKQITK